MLKKYKKIIIRLDRAYTRCLLLLYILKNRPHRSPLCKRETTVVLEMYAPSRPPKTYSIPSGVAAKPIEKRGEGPEPDGDSAVQALAAALKRCTSLRRPAAGGEGRALRGAGGGRRQARCGRSQSGRSCMLGAGQRRAAWLLGEGGGQGSAAGAVAKQRGPGAGGAGSN
jgi:hypothetical protein